MTERIDDDIEAWIELAGILEQSDLQVWKVCVCVCVCVCVTVCTCTHVPCTLFYSVHVWDIAFFPHSIMICVLSLCIRLAQVADSL